MNPYLLRGMNPYLPLPEVTNLEVFYVMRPELRRQQHRAGQWAVGRADRVNGEPCKSANGAYLEGWYSV